MRLLRPIRTSRSPLRRRPALSFPADLLEICGRQAGAARKTTLGSTFFRLAALHGSLELTRGSRTSLWPPSPASSPESSSGRRLIAPAVLLLNRCLPVWASCWASCAHPASVTPESGKPAWSLLGPCSERKGANLRVSHLRCRRVADRKGACDLDRHSAPSMAMRAVERSRVVASDRDTHVAAIASRFASRAALI